MRWPWDKKKEEEAAEKREERSGEIFFREIEAMSRDINQIKEVNRHMLARLVAKHWVDEDQEDIIRAIQMTSKETTRHEEDVVEKLKEDKNNVGFDNSTS